LIHFYKRFTIGIYKKHQQILLRLIKEKIADISKVSVEVIISERRKEKRKNNRIGERRSTPCN